jgi:hypothetical protein
MPPGLPIGYTSGEVPTSVSDHVAPEAFALARFVLRLTFVILTALGLAVSALLMALAYAVERLYSVPALPWAFATLALPACGLLVLAFSTRLAAFVAGSPEISRLLPSGTVRGVLGGTVGDLPPTS